MDDARVCDSEREEACRMYGPRMRNSSFAVTKNGSVRSPSIVCVYTVNLLMAVAWLCGVITMSYVYVDYSGVS